MFGQPIVIQVPKKFRQAVVCPQIVAACPQNGPRPRARAGPAQSRGEVSSLNAHRCRAPAADWNGEYPNGMNQDWWVCSYCYRSNHPLWSKCQTCRAPRLQPADAYGAAQHAGETAGAAGSGASTKADTRHEPVPQPSTKSGAVKLAAVVEPAAAKATTAKNGPSPKRPRRKAARNGDTPDSACPKCGQVMEAEWNHCPRCGWARVRATAREIKVAPLPAPSTRPLRRLGMVQPVPDLVESNGTDRSEEDADQGPEE